MKKYIHNQNGLTLIEVLVALAIIGIAGAIIIPSSGIVHKNRLKNIASQLSMDIQKVCFFSQTHENIKTGNDYEYKIVFENEEHIGGNLYYTSYRIGGKEFSSTSSVIDNIVKIRPIAKDGTGDKVIREIQFDNKGRIQIIAEEEPEPIFFSSLIGEEAEGKGIIIMLRIDDKHKKEIIVNALTGTTLIED